MSLQAMLRGAPLALDESAVEMVMALASECDALPPDGTPGAMLLNDEDLQPLGYTVIDEVAFVEFRGPVIPKTTPQQRHKGFVSASELAAVFHAIARDDGVKSMILEVASPGGMADGVETAAAALRAIPKPTRAHIEGVAASAGYWIGSAADEIYARPTARAGSIGAILTMKEDPTKGLVVITSKQSPLKNAPVTTDEGRGVYQQVVDDLAGIFISRVAEYRGTTEDVVLSDYGQGAIMVADRAQKAGLIDGILGAQMEEQLREAKAQITALTEERDGLQTKVGEGEASLSAALAERDALTERLEVLTQERDEALQLVESAKAEKAAQEKLAYEERRESSVQALVDDGKITVGQKAHYAELYDLQYAEGSTSKVFDNISATLKPNSAVNFEEVGSGAAAPKAPTQHQRAEAKAKEEGISYDAAFEQILSEDASKGS